MSEVIDASVVVLQQVAKLLQTLSPDQVEKLVSGAAHLEFVAGDERVAAATRRSSTQTKPKLERLSVAEAARQLRVMSDLDERKACLGRVLAKELPSLAKQLDVDISGLRLKDERIDRIAESLPPSAPLNVDADRDEVATDADRPREGMSGLERLMGGRWPGRAS